jgi:hypothetical protein
MFRKNSSHNWSPFPTSFDGGGSEMKIRIMADDIAGLQFFFPFFVTQLPHHSYYQEKPNIALLIGIINALVAGTVRIGRQAVEQTAFVSCFPSTQLNQR